MSMFAYRHCPMSFIRHRFSAGSTLLGCSVSRPHRVARHMRFVVSPVGPPDAFEQTFGKLLRWKNSCAFPLGR